MAEDSEFRSGESDEPGRVQKALEDIKHAEANLEQARELEARAAKELRKAEKELEEAEHVCFVFFVGKERFETEHETLTGVNENDYSDIHDRQVRAFGAAGQRLISRMKVGIVGLGGTGSVVAQELAHLGVGHFVLIDPDTLDTTNRNRVVGSEESDLGTDKVELAGRLIRRINKDVLVEPVKDTVIKSAICALLLDCQFVFLCTDSHSSRAMVSKLCYQYMIPGIDVGVSISVADTMIEYVAGRTQMIAPGLPCLLCTGSIDANAIRQELMSPEHRAADPYFNGDGEPQPAVISLNATMSSLAVTMFLAAVAGVPMNARYQRYDGIAGTVRPVAATAQDHCLVCSKAGVLGRGQSQPLTL